MLAGELVNFHLTIFWNEDNPEKPNKELNINVGLVVWNIISCSSSIHLCVHSFRNCVMSAVCQALCLALRKKVNKKYAPCSQGYNYDTNNATIYLTPVMCQALCRMAHIHCYLSHGRLSISFYRLGNWDFKRLTWLE